MQTVNVTLRTADNSQTHTTQGTAPHADCALAVVPVHVFCNATRAWRPASGWCVTHRPSGLALPGTFDSEGAALKALQAATPGFMGWLLATGRQGCGATVAALAMWRAARGTS